MTREGLLSMFDAFSNNMREIILERNRNYATDSDALKNIRYINYSGIQGHLKDKISRLETCNDMKVLADTCIDIANYAFLYQVLLVDDCNESM